MPDSRGEPAKKDLLTKLLKGLEGQPQTGAEHFSLPAWISLQSCCVLSCPVLSCVLMALCLCVSTVFTCLLIRGFPGLPLVVMATSTSSSLPLCSG